MSVSVISKQSKPPPDPLRAALDAALQEERAAKEALQAQRAAVTKLRRAVWDAETAHQRAEKGVQEALRAAGEEMALAAADDDDAPVPVSSVKLARAALTDASDHVEACRVAREATKGRIADYEAAASSATSAAAAAISAIVVPYLQSATDELRRLISAATPLRRLLIDALDAHRDNVVGFHGRRGIEDQLAAAGELVMRISDADISNVAGVFKAIRARLRQDPYAAIDLVAPAPQPPSAA